MKKIIAVCLVLVLGLAGCSPRYGSLSNVRSRAESSQASSSPLGFGASVEPSPEPIKVNTKIADGFFVFNSEKVLKTLGLSSKIQSEVFAGAYKEGGFNISWEAFKPFKAVSYADLTGDKSSAILIEIKTESGSIDTKSLKNLWVDCFDAIIPLAGIEENPTVIRDSLQLKSFPVGTEQHLTVNNVDIFVNWTDDVLTAVFTPVGTNITIGSLPKWLMSDEEPLVGDIEKLNTLQDLIKGFSYEEALTFMENNGNVDSDVLKPLYSRAGEIIEDLINCQIVSDDFENSKSVYYNGIMAISSEVNVVPKLNISDGGSTLECKLGFWDYDWLFFDRTKIKIGDDEYITNNYDSWNIETNVVDGGIEEIKNIISFKTDAESISTADGLPTIRFINSDNDKYKEHTFTDAEFQSVSTLLSIEINHKEILNTLYMLANVYD